MSINWISHTWAVTILQINLPENETFNSKRQFEFTSSFKNCIQSEDNSQSFFIVYILSASIGVFGSLSNWLWYSNCSSISTY